MKNTETAKQESTQDYNINDIEPYHPRPRFDTDHRGVWWINVRTGKDGEAIEAEPLLLSDPIDTSARGRITTARITALSAGRTKSHAKPRPPPSRKRKSARFRAGSDCRVTA